jgi:HSP20 family protein
MRRSFQRATIILDKQARMFYTESRVRFNKEEYPMPLLKYAPFSTEVDDLPNGLRLFQDSVARLLSEPNGRPWTPPVDIVENENELVLKADIPDVELKDVDIRMENGTLTLKGERRFEQTDNGRGYHRIERSYGSFARSFALPDSVESEKVKADYKNGVLTITLPKKEIAKPRSIKVEVNS